MQKLLDRRRLGDIGEVSWLYGGFCTGDLSAASVPGMIVGVTVADDHLARIGPVLDDCAGEDAASPAQAHERLPDCAREALTSARGGAAANHRDRDQAGRRTGTGR